MNADLELVGITADRIKEEMKAIVTPNQKAQLLDLFGRVDDLCGAESGCQKVEIGMAWFKSLA